MDEPRRAVEDADKLVASVMQRLAEGFANERSGLEKQARCPTALSFLFQQIAETVRTNTLSERVYKEVPLLN
jgi:hypothetical protein